MAAFPTSITRNWERMGQKQIKQHRRTRLETTLPNGPSKLETKKNQNTDTPFHLRGESIPKAPKRPGETKKYNELKWICCQAVRFSLEDKHKVEFRSFPFWAFSLEHARLQLIEMSKERGEPLQFDSIYQYGVLNQTAGKLSVFKGEKLRIDMVTGRKI